MKRRRFDVDQTKKNDARCAQALHSCAAAHQFAPLGHFIEHLARVNLGGSNGGFQRLQGSIDHPCSSVDPPLGVLHEDYLAKGWGQTVTRRLAVERNMSLSVQGNQSGIDGLPGCL
ncbi:hypothetical protein L3X38_031382 [Prunus dulcis]|uniref:Uncharacterized protein n=1 Tax=Prunus dulcis TaxID=3755 RepID=A0AAD4VC45_PRUDU|nr:hypothetical protein L3X38_031382 [Prunus dulcis]